MEKYTIYGLQDLIVLRNQLFPNYSIDSIQCQLKSKQFFFFLNRNQLSCFMWKCGHRIAKTILKNYLY